MKTLKVYQNKLIETFISGAMLLFFTPRVGNACERKKRFFSLLFLRHWYKRDRERKSLRDVIFKPELKISKKEIIYFLSHSTCRRSKDAKPSGCSVLLFSPVALTSYIHAMCIYIYIHTKNERNNIKKYRQQRYRTVV